MILYLLIVSALFSWVVFYLRQCNGIEGNPKPMSFFLVGHLPYFYDVYAIIYTFMRIKEKVGKIFTLLLAQNTFAVVSDKDHLEAILSDPRFQKKAKIYRYSRKWLGDGLLNSSGQKYLLRRKLLTPAFAYQNLIQYVDIFNFYGGIFVEKIRRHVAEPSVDLHEDVALCTLDIICETAMGISIDAQAHSNSTYVKNVKLMTQLMMERSTRLSYQFDLLYFFMRAYWKERKAVKMLHDFTDNIIKERRSFMTDNGVGGMRRRNSSGIRPSISFLDLLLQCNVGGCPLNDLEIREEVDTLMFQGHDSTASAMNFAFYCLAHNKHVQDKLVEEIEGILEGAERDANFEDLSKMKYLEMVILETLRWYPSFPLIGRQVEEDVVIKGNRYPAGSILLCFIYGTHRDGDYHPEPENFDPNRFSGDLSKKKDNLSYIPFSYGMRSCLGQKFAILEMKSLLAKVIRLYEFLPSFPEQKMYLAPQTVLRSLNGVNVRIKERC